MPYTDSDVAARDAMAGFLRCRGYNPLPSDFSDPDRRKPFVRFAHAWDGPQFEPDIFERHPSPWMQLMLGRAWGLLCIDLDGPAAVAWWDGLRFPKPRTWVVQSGGEGAGRHWYFSVPKGYAKPLPKAVLWTDGGKHSAAERLCDRSLVTFPPSPHHRTGRPFRWLSRQQSPARLSVPAMAPAWLLAMPDITPKRVVKMPERRRDIIACAPDSAGRYRADDVRAAIPDVIALCQSWGLRFTGRERAGWAECHAIDRPDDRPSAAVHRESGVYKDLGSGAKLGLFDLASEVGGLGRDWKEAVAILGERFRARTAA